MNITPGELALIQRRSAAPQLPRMVGGGVIFCAPGFLVNALNRYKGAHWTVDTGYRADWHERVANALFEAGYRRGNLNPKIPKTITIKAHVAKLFDSKTDGLRAACKPIPDALKKFGVIDDDGDLSPHTFAYDQVVDVGWRGAEVESAHRDRPRRRREARRAGARAGRTRSPPHGQNVLHRDVPDRATHTGGT